MVNRFDFGFTPSGMNRQNLVRRMKRQIADARASGGRADTRLVNIRQGPATRALARHRRMRAGERPRWASESSSKFVSAGPIDEGYGAHRKYDGRRTRHFEMLTAVETDRQDRARANRSVGETSANALTLINEGNARVGRRVNTILGVMLAFLGPQRHLDHGRWTWCR